MIIYFADRNLNIVGQASTELPDGLFLSEDMRTEEIETGVTTFEGEIAWNNKCREEAEDCVVAGNYIFKHSDDAGGELFTIVEAERQTKEQTVKFYAEDAGLSLLNETAIKWPDGRDATIAPAMTLTEYFDLFLYDTGFKIGLNAASTDTTKKKPEDLSSADNEQSVHERLLSIAEDFGYEINYSYSINENAFKVSSLVVNVYKKRGMDKGVTLILNNHVDNIVVKENTENLATALLAYGASGDNGEPVTLDGYSYSSPDNDFVVQNLYFASRKATKACLVSPSALAKWGRTVNGESHHVVKVFNDSGCGTKQSLAIQAAKELTKCKDKEINYEVDILRLPEDVRVGDYVYVVDEKGELYLKARVLKLEESVANHEHKATLGDYLIQSSGISQKVRDLASQFEQIASQRQFFTWIAYADDENGTNISLSPYNKKFIGIAVNQTSETVDITDLTVFSWVEIVGDKRVALNLQITSSAGQVFITTKVQTTLTAHVYLQGDELTAEQIADIGVIKWYSMDSQGAIAPYPSAAEQVTGQTCTVSNEDAINVTAQLEVEVV